MSSQVLSTQELAAPHAFAAWLRFLRAHAAITRELSSRLEALHGLTLSDYDVLVQLYHAPERRMRRIDIARSVLLTPSGITRLLDGLESCGYVEKGRCESDARVTYAVLTTPGGRSSRRRRSRTWPTSRSCSARSSEPHERKQLAELLGRLPLADTSEACSGDEAP